MYVIGPGHMNKMASMPKYSTNPLKIFFQNRTSDDLKLGRKQKGLKSYKSNITDDPVLTFTYFTRSYMMLYECQRSRIE